MRRIKYMILIIITITLFLETVRADIIDNNIIIKKKDDFNKFYFNDCEEDKLFLIVKNLVDYEVKMEEKNLYVIYISAEVLDYRNNIYFYCNNKYDKINISIRIMQ